MIVLGLLEWLLPVTMCARSMCISLVWFSEMFNAEINDLRIAASVSAHVSALPSTTALQPRCPPTCLRYPRPQHCSLGVRPRVCVTLGHNIAASVSAHVSRVTLDHNIAASVSAHVSALPSITTLQPRCPPTCLRYPRLQHCSFGVRPRVCVTLDHNIAASVSAHVSALPSATALQPRCPPTFLRYPRPQHCSLGVRPRVCVTLDHSIAASVSAHVSALPSATTLQPRCPPTFLRYPRPQHCSLGVRPRFCVTLGHIINSQVVATGLVL